MLERGSVEGEIFHRGGVRTALEETQVTTRLAASVGAHSSVPTAPCLPKYDGYRFVTC